MSLQLSTNFWLHEFTRTKHSLYNDPTIEQRLKLYYNVIFNLQPIRNKFGKIYPTSGYRNKEVNNAVGGAVNSQHAIGEAIDFISLESDILDVFKWAVINCTYSQLILETRKGIKLIHIGLPRIDKKNMLAEISPKVGVYKLYEG